MGTVTNHKLELDHTLDNSFWQLGTACYQQAAEVQESHLGPSVHLVATRPLAASQVFRSTCKVVGGERASLEHSGRRYLGRLMQPLKVAFQVWFKEGGFAGGKT